MFNVVFILQLFVGVGVKAGVADGDKPGVGVGVLVGLGDWNGVCVGVGVGKGVQEVQGEKDDKQYVNPVS
jgi:hypothetical protein